MFFRFRLVCWFVWNLSLGNGDLMGETRDVERYVIGELCSKVRSFIYLSLPH